MLRLLAFTAAAGLLGACQPSAEGQPENETGSAATNNATAAADDRNNAAAIAGIPTSPPANREEALKLMKARHENYQRIGDATKLISRHLKSDTPDLTAVQAAARTIATLAPQIPSWFPPGTGPDVGKTDARPEIWQKPEDFAVKAAALNSAASDFYGAAQGTDLAATRASFGSLGKTCKACHDLYREEN